MSTINIKDLIVIKRFMEKGFRENLYVDTELDTVRVVYVKLTNLIDEFLSKQPSNEIENKTE